MEENKNITENTGEFDGVGASDNVMEISKKSSHHHHHHHSSNHSSSSDNSSGHHSSSKSHQSSSESKSSTSGKHSRKDKTTKRLRRFNELKRYFLGGWVAILSIVIIVLSVWNFELQFQIKTHSDRLDKIKDDLGGYTGIGSVANSGGYEVPSYWQEAVNEAIDKINGYTEAAGRDCTIFAWFSDTHYMEGGKNYATGAITAAVMDSCNIPFAILSGDVLTQSVLETEDEVIDAYRAVYSMLSPIKSDRLLQVEGNHDGSWGKVDLDEDGEFEDGEYYQYNMTDEQIYNYMFRQHAADARRVYGESGTWFYIDDPVSKTRFIMLNDVWDKYETDSDTGVAVNNQMGGYGFGQEQLEWFAKEALSFDEAGWAIVVSAHVPVNQKGIRDGEIVLSILESFENNETFSGSCGKKGSWEYVDISVDFTKNKSNEIIGFYSGHVHKDSLVTSLSFPVVTITSNVNTSYDENEEEREYGTDNEVAVDFVVVNRKTKEVHHVRLGVGNDRYYNY